MVDVVKKLIVLGDKTYPIKRFAVWWMVDGYGLYPEIPTFGSIHAMPVAISDDGVYEVIPPEIRCG